MDFRRVTAWSGVAFVVLLLVGFFAPAATPPGLDDSIAKVASYYADKHDQVVIANVANTLATFAAVIFLVGLFMILRETEGRLEPWALVGLVGAIVLAGVATLGQAAVSLAILRGAEETGVSKVFNDFSLMAFALTGVLTGVSLLGFGMAIGRTRALPSWAGGLAFFVAGIGTLGSLSAGTDVAPLAFLTFVAFLLFALWVLGVSIWLLRSSPEATATPAG